MKIPNVGLIVRGNEVTIRMLDTEASGKGLSPQHGIVLSVFLNKSLLQCLSTQDGLQEYRSILIYFNLLNQGEWRH